HETMAQALGALRQAGQRDETAVDAAAVWAAIRPRVMGDEQTGRRAAGHPARVRVAPAWRRVPAAAAAALLVAMGVAVLQRALAPDEVRPERSPMAQAPDARPDAAPDGDVARVEPTEPRYALENLPDARFDDATGHLPSYSEWDVAPGERFV